MGFWGISSLGSGTQGIGVANFGLQNPWSIKQVLSPGPCVLPSRVLGYVQALWCMSHGLRGQQEQRQRTVSLIWPERRAASPHSGGFIDRHLDKQIFV